MQVYRTSFPFNSTCIRPGQNLDFGDFQIGFISFLAEGSSKKCWKAFYTCSGQKYLKAVLVHASVRTKEAAAQIINEISVHRLLEGHPAIVNVDRSLFIRANGSIYWIQVMHLYSDNLFRAIRDKFFIDRSLVIDVLDQLAKGMAYIHSRGIVQGDVTPSNILFEEGIIKFTDFGGADYKEKFGSIQTFDYRAPEGFEAPFQDSFKTNIWSLGLIFAFIINNRGIDSPYEMCKRRGLIRSWTYKSATTDFIKTIKPYPGLTETTIAMMDLNPSKRPSSEEVLKKLRYPKASMPTRKVNP
jgi:serine/threonine protein kinase